VDKSYPVARAARAVRSIAAPGTAWRSRTPCPGASPPARALGWIQAHESPTGGILVHSRHPGAYPEVSGYLVPTLLACGERALAARTVRWLIAIQRGDGSFAGPDDGQPYVFDTGQALRGLLAGAALSPDALPAAERAARFLLERMLEGGRGGYPERYAGTIPEPIHLYALPPLLAAARVFDRPAWRSPALDCLDFYARHGEALNLDHLTHFLAYELETLLDLGREDLARPVLDALEEAQAEDGSVRGKGGARWVCTPGLAQIAICWYRIGRPEAADRALDWLERHQEKSGGFRGSLGRGASYFPDVEPAWAVKFYLDAHRLRALWYFERLAGSFPAEVPGDDGRSRALLKVVRPGHKVLEVGCGKGRFLRMLLRSVADLEVTGVDISPAMLSELPSGALRVEGGLESIPCPENRYDVAFSVEAIEHSVNFPAAIAELIRVTRPGGWVVVIDKQESGWGRLKCPPWERWPDADGLKQLLARGCDEVTSVPVAYDGRPADGLMVVWRGRKRSPLTGSEWNSNLVARTTRQAVLDRLRSGGLSPWAQEILLATSAGQRVLEVGSGTGEMSLALALGGRGVTIMDLSRESLEFAAGCAAELGVSLEAVQADATERFASFHDGQFDCVFSSGLLEHFSTEVRRAILAECARVSRGRVIALVPNASCIAYRLGKEIQEATGDWVYGLETPVFTLREDFEAAGLRVVDERSVGGRHALGFIPAGHPLRGSLTTWIGGRSEDELRDWNQGYLLFTEGVKARGAADGRPA
jgi:ubiquinone/menaquinone biosynthesis C-methylase UbiE